MNKKGIFVSLTAVLILIVIISLLAINNRQLQEVDDISAQYSKQKVTVYYLKDIEDIYVPTMIGIAESYGMYNLSLYIDTHGTANDLEEKLTEFISTGNYSGNEIMQYRRTLPGLLDEAGKTLSEPVSFSDMEIKVTSIEHLDEWTLELNTSVNFTVTLETTTWRNVSKITWKSIKNYSNAITIYGFIDPDEEAQVTSQWQSHPVPCFIKKLDPSKSCNGVGGLCSLGGCGP